MDIRKNWAFIVVLVAMFWAVPVGAQSIDLCATPTAWRTPTPYASPTPFGYSLPDTHTLVIMDTNVVTITSRMTETFDVAYTLFPSLSTAYSETAIAYPVKLVKELVGILPVWMGVITALVALKGYQIALTSILATTKQANTARSGISSFIDTLQNTLNQVPAVVKWAVLLLPVFLYACNRWVV